jgi:hypothetical protein
MGRKLLYNDVKKKARLFTIHSRYRPIIPILM